MQQLSTSDLVLLVFVALGACYYLFGDALKSRAAAAKEVVGGGEKAAAESGSGRDFVQQLKTANKKICIFYGSQTGTAEDYATRLAKECKSRYGMSSLVCDPEEYDFDTLDQVPEDHLLFFVVATYGEGEPTDNAVQFWDFLRDESVTFSNGGADLSNLRYVVFGLGNKTYEHFCAMGKNIDERLEKLGGKRIGPRGEGDDDKSMEEDYLAWKDDLFKALEEEAGFAEGQGLDSSDYEVKELGQGDIDEKKVYHGELSQRALTGTRGVFDAKNPYPAPLKSTRELFLGGDRNCIFAEFDIADAGLRYQAGDHIGIWPLNPDRDVLRLLKVLGLDGKADTIIEVTSLDPALAKVPFPTPTTYDAIFRHYVDICAVASRQVLGALAQYGPTDEARKTLERLGSDKAAYAKEVGDRCLQLSQILMRAAGDDCHADPENLEPTVWRIPFDRIISTIPRLQPRYYSISSSPKLHPNTVHITAVVLKYEPESRSHNQKQSVMVHGVGTNYLLNLKIQTGGETVRVAKEDKRHLDAPRYRIEGPRGKFRQPDKGLGYTVPVHIRRSNFRLPTSPKIPVIMIGPGTGVAPFRGFVQERVALARKAKEADGPDALKDWGPIILFYGCRKKEDDFLYEEEWKQYGEELGEVFKIFVAFSRQPGEPKTHVQQLIRREADLVKRCLVEKRGYAFICGDAKHMAHDVEELLKDLLGEAKGGGREAGEKEYKQSAQNVPPRLIFIEGSDQ